MSIDGKPEPERKYYGVVVPFFDGLTNLLTAISRAIIVNRRAPVDIREAEDDVRHASALRVERFLGCMVVDTRFLAAGSRLMAIPLRFLALLPVTWRIIDMAAYALRVVLFDPIQPLPAPPHVLISAVRSVLLGYVNLAELVLCFASYYAAWPQFLSHSAWASADWLTPVYFSVMTQATVGYGDWTPTGPFRVLACLQVAAGLLLVTALIPRMLNLLQRSDVLSPPSAGTRKRDA